MSGAPLYRTAPIFVIRVCSNTKWYACVGAPKS